MSNYYERERSSRHSRYDDRHERRSRYDEERDVERSHRRRRSRSRPRYSRDTSRDRYHKRSSHRDRDAPYESHRDRREHRDRDYDRGAAGDDHGLADVKPLSQWERKLKLWDMPPPGFEHLTAMQAKTTGLFAKGGMGIPFSAVPRDGPTGYQAVLSAAATGQLRVPSSRKIYVGNLPTDCAETRLKDYFNELMATRSDVVPGDSVIAIELHADKHFAFIEFRNTEEAKIAMEYDGRDFEGQSLKLRPPKEFMGQTSVDLVPNRFDSPHKIVVENVPLYLNEVQMRELMEVFGELKSFSLERDAQGQSIGYVYCEYLNPEITDQVCEGLTGLTIGRETLNVERVSKRAGVASLDSGAVPSASLIHILSAIKPTDLRATTVLQLLNTVSVKELEDDAEYEEIQEDIRQECKLHGNVISMHIPRPKEGEEVPALGRVFVEFEDAKQAESAATEMAGRRFNGRVVLACYYPEDKYHNGEYA